MSIDEVWDWGDRKGMELFYDYMMKWMELKLKSSPVPNTESIVDYVNSINGEYGLNLVPDDIKPNPAMRSLSKLGTDAIFGACPIEFSSLQV